MPLLMNSSSSSRFSRAGLISGVPAVLLVLGLLGVSGCCRDAADRSTVKAGAQAVEAGAGTATSAEAETGFNGLRRASARVSIDFPGGTLGDLRKYLPKAPNPPFNLIVGDDAAAVPLPAFSVRDVDSTELANALNHQVHGHGVSIMARDFVPLHGSGTPAYVTFRQPGEIENVRYLEFKSIEIQPADALRLSAAVQSAWQVFFGSDNVPATLRYHAETRQLFVSGPASALAVFERVLETFPKDENAQAGQS